MCAIHIAEKLNLEKQLQHAARKNLNLQKKLENANQQWSRAFTLIDQDEAGTGLTTNI